jgi:polygalacturonase
VNAFISARNARNITIEGGGVIDGQAQYTWGDYQNDDVETSNEVEIARQAGVELKRSYRVGNVAYTFFPQYCDNVHITGVRVRNSSAWCMKIFRCNHVTLEGVTINSDLKLGVNSDGVDLDGSSNVHIYGCTICTGDDAICVKAEAGNYASTNHVFKPIGSGYPAENIVVDNCILTSSSTAMMIGTETCSDIRHVVFSNCVIRDANKGFGINVQDGGTVSDVLFANITMDLQRRDWFWWGDAEAFYFVLKQRLPESPVGAIRNISIDNVIAHAQGTSRILATAGKPLENISINNLQLFMEPEATPDKRASNAIAVDGVTGLKLNNVAIRWDDAAPEDQWQSALVLKHVDGFEMQDVSARQGILGSAAPAIVLSDASNGIIRDNEAQSGTGTFFAIHGAGTKHLLFLNNVADEAASFVAPDPAVNPAEVREEGTIQKIKN